MPTLPGFVTLPAAMVAAEDTLGHAVALGDGEFHIVSGQEVVDRLFGTPGNGIAARGIVADEGEILVLQLGVNSQLLVVGGHAEHVLGLVLPDQAAQLIGGRGWGR